MTSEQKTWLAIIGTWRSKDRHQGNRTRPLYMEGRAVMTSLGCSGANRQGWARCVSAVLSMVLLVQVLNAQDTPPEQPAPTAPQAEAQPAAKPLTPEAEQAIVDDTNKTAVTAAPADEDQIGRPARNGGEWRPPMVVIGRDAEVAAGDSVEALVVIGGSANVKGRVREAAVVIGGDLIIEGSVGEAAVAVLGNITAHRGARVRGDAVAVGGRVKVSEGARVRNPQAVEFPDVTWLRKWLVQCVLLMRPLSLKVTWVWFVAGIFVLLYLLIAALFPRPVRACVNELTERPATTFCLGLLTIFLAPLAIVILGITGVGLLVVPFALAALFFGALIGRVAVLEWIGWRLAHTFGAQDRSNALTGVLLGALLVAVLYLVPFLGLVTFAIVSLWSLGGAVTAAFGGLRREMPQKPKPESVAAAAPAMASAFAPGVPAQDATAASAAMAGGSAAMPGSPDLAPGFGGASEPQARAVPPASPVSPPLVPEALTYPKASFWQRLAAAFLDLILVGFLCVVLHPIALLVALAYFSGLWAWKGTTIGGIVVGLKVVRADGQPLTFPVTLVRSLAAAFSVFVFFLGFLWIAWDPEKQGWHDKIAGTFVVKLPKGTPLL